MDPEDRHSVRSDLGPNCWQRQNSLLVRKELKNTTGIYLQMTKDHIYNVVLFADGGWMVDQKEVCISS